MTGRKTIELRQESDLVLLRKTCREILIQLGFRLVAQTKLVTAASELGRNVLTHGGGGQAHFDVLERSGRRGLKMEFVDQGPGIADIRQAMTDGYTTAGGLGFGLGAAQRLANEFIIQSTPGQGTRVTIIGWTL
ncbi:anti-sigma regulatory factor [Geothermobacter hydrogeniphilus]|uniref:Anti-sigma regulatory factor n=1 Tax=Geothermobacter hydrogeniphilus TaxID=1969733 RepID=A0A1X0YD21_9BACT|nr:anti-sigma regulatory factor [Geothermobacter hydrogeniphilus]ORJ63002.1 anti-sigma regulatory factor [Geothermobacter hydrogeniphilus]